MAAHNELGKWGEDLAAEYLECKGYTIIERDWKSGRRDLDIIAQDGEVIVFVEVKTRRNSLYGQPEEAVDYHKLHSLNRPSATTSNSGISVRRSVSISSPSWEPPIRSLTSNISKTSRCYKGNDSNRISIKRGLAYWSSSVSLIQI